MYYLNTYSKAGYPLRLWADDIMSLQRTAARFGRNHYQIYTRLNELVYSI